MDTRLARRKERLGFAALTEFSSEMENVRRKRKRSTISDDLVSHVKSFFDAVRKEKRSRLSEYKAIEIKIIHNLFKIKWKENKRD